MATKSQSLSQAFNRAIAGALEAGKNELDAAAAAQTVQRARDLFEALRRLHQKFYASQGQRDRAACQFTQIVLGGVR